jgi:hypothetical protein
VTTARSSLAAVFLLFCAWVVLALVISATLAPHSGLRAQEPQPTPIDQQYSTYRGLLEQYRADEREYQLLRQQYYQLQTLNSLEEAVQGTRLVYLSRQDVLISFLEIAIREVQQAPGIEENERGVVLSELQTVLTKLKDLRRGMDQLATREDAARISAEFAAIRPQVAVLFQRSVLLVRVGRAKAIFAQSRNTQQAIEAAVEAAGLPELRFAEKKRAVAEIDKLVTSIDEQLLSVDTEYAEAVERTNDREFPMDTKGINALYSEFNRLHAYLAELAVL